VTIPLQTKIIYGPLKSRRFGNSLGINLLPSDQKVCNFDCVYCQYDRSALATHTVFPELNEIEAEASLFMSDAVKQGVTLDWITIAGNGEPTLHPQFEEVVKRLLALRDRLLPGVPVGILSNASTCHRPEIRRTLALLDGRFMKLDAGSPSVFASVNRPSGPERWGGTVAGLRALERTVLQSLFFDGTEHNVEPAQIDDWVDIVGYIRPESVQVYTIDRPTRLHGLQAVPTEKLQRIAAQLTTQTGIPADIY